MSTATLRPGDTSRIFSVLKQYWGYDTLRPLQGESIAATTAGRDSLTVMPTGGGKSLCYQIPPLVSGKLTLVVSPLIALMQDQIAGLRAAGISAAAFHSHLADRERNELRTQAEQGELSLMLVAPERLVMPDFLSWAKRLGIGAIAIDEAHCISQWGHDFRPDYRQLGRLRSLFPDVPIGGYTATATPRVQQDILEQLHLHEPAVFVGSFDRPNLTYRVLPRVNLVDQVIEALDRHKDRAAIVYCITRNDTDLLAGALKKLGVDAAPYHAGLSPNERSRVNDAFRNERLNVVVATVAFGMGIDRGDVRCVIHAAMPKSVEHYQQETGRSGRDGLPAECLLLCTNADVQRWKQVMQRGAADAGDAEAADAALNAQLALLDQMHRFAGGGRCRHRAICEHFGQTYDPPSCGACDFCLNELSEVPDSHAIAQKILSCVYRCGQNVGAAHIADVLHGSRSARILVKGHDQISTHGLLSNIHRDQVMSYIDQLVETGFLQRSPGQFPVLQLSSRSNEILKNRIQAALYEPKVTVKEPGKRRAAKSDSGQSVEEQALTPIEAEMFDALRLWRRGFAEARGVPPFVILGDSTLEELVRVRPASLETLVCVRGIGNKKLQDFGNDLLVVIAKESGARGLRLDAMPGTRARALPVVSDEPDVTTEKTRMSTSASIASEFFKRGESLEEVAAKMKRALSTVGGYLDEFVRATRPASIRPWVPEDVENRIVEAIAETGSDRLKPIFEYLGGSVHYEQIRLVLSHRQGIKSKM